MGSRGLAAATLVALLLTSGCTGSDDDEPSPDRKPAAAAPSELEPAWSADLGPAAKPVPQDTFAYRTHGELDVWSTDDTVVVVGRRGLQAFDVATGDPAWTLPVPARLGSVCAVSPELGTTGLGGLLFASTGRCDAAGVVDVTTGRLTWSAPLAQGPSPLDPAYADRPVHVGARTLTVEVPCDELRRYDLGSGAVLPDPFRRRGDCTHDVAVGGGVQAVVDRTTDVLSLADADSDRRLWTHAMPAHSGVDAVVSTDPLVLDVTERGHRVLRTYDDRGRPGAYVGRQMDTDPKLLGVLDGVLVVSYSTSALATPLFRGFDPETGEQLWRSDDELYAAGEQDGRIFTLFRPLGSTSTDATAGVWVGRADPRDPTDQVALGRIPYDEDATYGWTDDVLVRQVGARLDAYRLPDAGEDADAPAMPPLPGQQPEPTWADDDVRPEQVGDLCTTVRPATLRSLGFRSADLPTPATCAWHDVLDDPDTDRLLAVETFAVAPRDGRSAAEEAHRQLVDLRTSDINWPGPVRAVSGLGDEAQLAQKRTRSESESRLGVRVGNVVLVIHSDVRTYGAKPPPALSALLAGQRRVLDDLTAALG